MNNKKLFITVTHADTSEKIEKGLMFRKRRLNKNHGMLFHTGYRISRFWMKNTFIPLDIIFLNKNGRIIGFVENTTPLSLAPITINKPSTFVLEMNAGWIKNNNANKGDYIVL